METEGPYAYPLTDRADIIAFLGEHQSYWPMRPWNRGFVLAWDIKVHYRFDTSGHGPLDTGGHRCTGDFKFEERFDEAWEAVVEADDMMFWEVCEDATRMYTEEEWTRYPGVEQGEWKFGINGRSGGWMILTDWPGRKPNPGAVRMSWDNRDDYQDWLEHLNDAELERFYKAIVQLDQDLSCENCREAIEYQYAFRRAQWEEEMLAEEDTAARKLEASRPDMYEVKGDE